MFELNGTVRKYLINPKLYREFFQYFFNTDRCGKNSIIFESGLKVC